MASTTELTSTTKEDLFDEARKALKVDQRTNFRIICLVSDHTWDRLLSIADGWFDIADQGELHQLHSTYSAKNQLHHVYLYLYQHPATGAPIVFTLNSGNDLSETFDRWVTGTEDLYNLWLSPESMDELQDHLLEKTGLELQGFDYDTFGREPRYEAEIRPGIQRSGSHQSEDAENMLEEWRVQYGITATRLRFKLATRGTFRFSNDGEFVLEDGKPDFLYEEVAEEAVHEAHPLNELMKAADLSRAVDDGFEHFEEKLIEIRIPDTLDYEDHGALTAEMEKADFYPYSEQAAEGSLLYNGRIADERNDGIISISTNGEDMTLLPRYDTGFDSLVRFYRFLVEKVDPEAEIITAGV